MKYFDIVINALDCCRKNKSISIFRYCIMPSHIHLLFRSEKGEPSELIRDFKGFGQKLNYIHQNPVKERIVTESENYYFSSARNYSDLDSALDIEVIFMG